MEIFKNIFGSKESSEPLIINVDTVYINSNVREVTKNIDGKELKEFQYDQIQMSKDEYIALSANQNDKLKTELTNLMDLNLEKEETIEKLTKQLNNVLEALLESEESEESKEEKGVDENEEK